MSELNAAVCATNLRNTGTGSCVINPKLITWAARVPANKVFTAAELLVLRETLEAARLAPLKANRIFPIDGFTTPTDSSEETVFQTMGDGSQVPVRDGHYRWMFQYQKGGLCKSIALRSHNFQDTTWIFGDNKGLILGYRKQISAGVYGLAGIPNVFHAMPWKMATGSEVASYRVMFDFEASYLNEFLGFVQADFPLAEIAGLQDLVLRQTGASAAGVSKIQVLTGCDYANVYDLYNGELDNIAAWTAINTATGNAIGITSVVADPNAKAFTVTLTAADPDYPATSGGLVTINLVDPTALDALDVSGFEGIPVTILRG